jgi:hypothetical protein
LRFENGTQIKWKGGIGVAFTWEQVLNAKGKIGTNKIR